MVDLDTSLIELSGAQRRVLGELVNMYNNRDGRPIKGKEIAEALERKPGTIRTQMQSLKSLQLVNGIPGPKGGYEPTARAYEMADLERSEEYTRVPFHRDGEPVGDANVSSFGLIDIDHPDRHEAELAFRGPVPRLCCGDDLTVGPMPGSGLVVEATVDGVDTEDDICVVRIDEMYFVSDEDGE